MRYAHCITITPLLLWILLSTWAMAEAPPSDKEETGIFRLGEVEVTATYETPRGTVDLVDEASLRRFNRDDMAEALDLMPGVTLSRTGARNERTIYVRGFDAKHVPLFLDGIPIYVMYDGYPDLARFTTFDTARIVLSKGAASVLYGFNTMGGAINVITKRPANSFETNAGIGLASGNTTKAYANFGSNRGKWYFQGGASYVNQDHVLVSGDFEPAAAEDGGERENSYYSDRKVSFKVGYQPSPEDEYAFSYSRQEAEKGTPPYAGDSSSEKIRYWQWPKWDKESFYINAQKAIGAESYAKMRMYYDIYENSLFSYDDDTYTTQDRNSSFKSWYDDNTFGGSLEVGTRLSTRNDLKAALHYKLDQHKEHDGNEPLRTFRDEYYSVGIEDNITLSDQWHILAGAGFDWQNALKAEDYNSDTGIISDMPTQEATAFNPQLGLFFDFSDTQTLYATIARKSRFPSLKDRYSYRMGTALANPGLEPEIAVNYDFGYLLASDRTTFESAVYFSSVEDYIQSVTIPDPDDETATLYQNQNVGEVWLYGVEAKLALRFADDLDAGLNYTCVQWENRSSDEKLTDIPAHKVSVNARYTPWEKAGLSIDAQHYSGRHSSSDGSRDTDSFTIVNITVDYVMFKGLKLEAGINNIFDTNYELQEGYPEQGLSCFANLTYRR